MGPIRKKGSSYPEVSWSRWIILFSAFIVVLHTIPISCSSIRTSVIRVPVGGRTAKRNSRDIPRLQFDNFEPLSDDDGSSGFTVISPFLGGERTQGEHTVGKHKRVVRRRRKKLSETGTPLPTVVTSVTLHPSGETVTSLPVYEAPPKRRHKKKSHQGHKIPEVWKVQNFNLHDEADAIISDLKTSMLDKRESSEKHSPNKYNYTSLFDSSRETTTTRDLNYDESINTHPFFNSSTPISNELQNSLQFTLQFLHPLLNSDVDLSENGQKHPENKTVALTHSLSDSVAQTPVDSDLGFLPSHLKKKHPLLNQDSFISGEGGTGASKTGIRINSDIVKPKTRTRTTATPNEETTTSQPTLDTTIFYNAPTKIPESSEDTFSSTEEVPTTAIPRITIPRITTSRAPTIKTTTTTRKTPTFIRRHTTTTTTTVRPTSTTTTSSTTTTATPTTTTAATTTSTIRTTIRTTSTTQPTTTTTPTTPTTPVTSTEVVPFNLDHILGILNITELQTGSSAETSSKDRDQLNEAFQDPPVIMLPPEVKASTTDTPASTSSSTTLRSSSEFPVTRPSNIEEINTSGEVSSAEQLFVEQLLGLGSKSKESGGKTSGQSDSGEQLLQLFGNLLQGQLQNQGKTSSNTNIQQNPFPPIGSTSGKSQNLNNANDAQTNALLQSLLLSSLNPAQSNQPADLPTNLFNLESLLTPTSTVQPQPGTSRKPPPTTTTKQELTPHIKAETGLSDSDLKSIFQLLDSQASSPSPTTTTTATTLTTTTTTRPTTTPSPRSLPPSTHTTTLHPALQSMLDMFTNQLKPFQSIPATSSTTSTFLQTLAKPSVPAPTKPPTTTKPTQSLTSTTLNSIDLLTQLLSLGAGGAGGLNKINPVRSTPAPPFSLASLFGGAATPKTPQNPEFSLASIFGNLGGQPKANNFNTNNIFGIAPQLPKAPTLAAPTPIHDTSAPSESNQLLNFFGSGQTTPPPPSGIYYWLDMNAFLGGDPKADGMAGIRPKIGNRYPFIKVN